MAFSFISNYIRVYTGSSVVMYLHSKETTRDRSLAVVMMVRDLGDCGQVSLIRAKKKKSKTQ